MLVVDHQQASFRSSFMSNGYKHLVECNNLESSADLEETKKELSQGFQFGRLRAFTGRDVDLDCSRLLRCLSSVFSSSVRRYPSSSTSVDVTDRKILFYRRCPAVEGLIWRQRHTVVSHSVL